MLFMARILLILFKKKWGKYGVSEEGQTKNSIFPMHYAERIFRVDWK